MSKIPDSLSVVGALTVGGAESVVGNLTVGGSVSFGGVQFNSALSYYEPYEQLSVLTNSTLGLNTLYFAPFDVYQVMSASRLDLFMSIATTFSATNLAGTFGATLSAAIYSMGTGTGTAQAINTLWSQSAAWAFSQSSNSNLSATIPVGINGASVSTLSTTFATSNASNFMISSVGGFRELALPFGSTLAPGRYWLALGYSSGAATGGTFQIDMSIMQKTIGGQLGFMPMGGASSASGSGFAMKAPFGTYSATSGAFPASFAMTNINVLFKPPISATIPLFNVRGIAYGLSNL